MSVRGIVSAVASLAGNRNFSLGGFAFLDTEVPAYLSWGGMQSTSVFWAPGGAKTICSEGYFDAPLSWQGVFRGYDAVSRAQTLESMARTGAVYAFSGASLVRQVVITEFRANYTQSGNIVPYYITCEVLPVAQITINGTKSALASLIGSDTASALLELSTTMSSLTSYSAQITSAASVYTGQITPLATLFGAGGSVSKVSATLSGVSAVSSALSSTSSSAILNAAGTALSSSGNSVAALIGVSGTELSSIAANSGADLVSDMGGLSAAVVHSGVVASGAISGAYINRATANAGIITGSTSLSATTLG